MTITCTFTEDDLCRVDIAATGLAAADVALVERSTDQLRWTTVRGAAAWPCSGGVFVRALHDYEFTPGVVNYYRVSGMETAAMAVVNAGSAVSGNNASLNPGLPAAIVEHDLLILFASIRNSGTGTVNVPAGWTPMRAFGNMALIGRYYVTGDAAPTVTFAGGVANADTLARILAIRSAKLQPVTGIDQLNGSAQNAAAPALSVPQDDMFLLDTIWKQDDVSTVGNRTGSGSWTAVGSPLSSTAGDDAAQHWMWQLQTAAANLAVDTHVITGGGAAISRTMTIALEHADWLNQQTGTVTPVLTSHWLKSIPRPYLNMPVSLGKRRDRRHAGRSTSLPIVNRTDPVAITDLRASPAFDLLVRTRDPAEEQRLRNLLAGGDILLLHAPAGSRYRTVYVDVGDVTEGVLDAALLEHWLLPCQTSAAPEADVVGATTTCDTILSDFATCADVMAEFATCADVMEYIADPEDVIVP